MQSKSTAIDPTEQQSKSIAIDPTERENQNTRIRRQRSFNRQQREECWKNSKPLLGRDLDRWRLDALGNPVFRKYAQCHGPLCYEYDHILPFSKGGETTVQNCQIMQTTANRFKSNKIDYEISFSSMKAVIPAIDLTDDMMDAIEIGAYGNIAKKEGQIQKYVDHNIQVYNNVNPNINSNINSNNNNNKNQQ